MLFSADFEKSFDSIDRSFICTVLEKFGYGPNFIHWIRTLYNGAERSVMNKGHSTGYFPLERGTRQRDLISAYHFILALEILFLSVRQNIQGITTEDICTCRSRKISYHKCSLNGISTCYLRHISRILVTETE